MSSFPAADSPSDSQKLVPFNVAKDRVKNELAGAVRDLGSGGEESENLSSLVRKIRALFPELMQLRGDQDATVELRDRQIHELSPYLLGTNTLIGGSAPENEGSGAEPLENPLDEVARRITTNLQKGFYLIIQTIQIYLDFVQDLQQFLLAYLSIFQKTLGLIILYVTNHQKQY